MTNKRNIFFNELYLIDKKYFFELQRITNKPIEEALYCYWNENGRINLLYHAGVELPEYYKLKNTA